MDQKEAARHKLSKQKKKKDDEQNIKYTQINKLKEKKQRAVEKRAKYNPPTPFYDRLMKKGKDYEIAV